MKVFVAFAAVALFASPALAQGGSGAVSGSDLATQNDIPESSGQAGQNAAGERRICRRIETDSSTRRASRRVCRTAQEWREAQRTQ